MQTPLSRHIKNIARNLKKDHPDMKWNSLLNLAATQQGFKSWKDFTIQNYNNRIQCQ